MFGIGFAKRLCTATVAIVILPGMLLAQSDGSPIPERRVNLFENTDFFGSDLQNIFEVPYAQCEAQCLATTGCRAFTYNQKASACFLKSAAGEKSEFEGALSAEVLEAGAQQIAKARKRAEALSFLPPDYLQSALKVAARNGANYPTNGWQYQPLVEVAQRRENEGNLMRAIELHLAALNVEDLAEGWIEVARLANFIDKSNSQHRSFLNEIAPAAAVNGYLRATAPSQQASALLELSYSLEDSGRKRLIIPTLRLASQLSARREIEDALDRAIKLFGFRITDHRIDQNSQHPRVCAEFNENLVKNGVDYAPFVKASVDGVSVEPSGRQLCVEGVTHGEQLRVTFRQGLPADSGEKLAKSVDLNVYVPDRDPTAQFGGRNYILPKRENASIPLVTVNLETVDLKIYRVSDRNIIRSIQNGLFSRQVSQWDVSYLADEVGAEIWKGEVDVELNLNREVTTALPVGQAIKEFEPGVYALTATDPGNKNEGSPATQWFVVTDLGISTLVGNDGLHVFTKSLGSATAQAGVKVQLIAKNNSILGETVTDAAGYAHFAAGLVRGKSSNSPALITVLSDDGDFAFLDQSAAEFDLSDRGVEGRAAPPPIDAFLATDRGAYRPGETIHVTLLARNTQVAAIRNLPLTLDVLRPDGVRFRRQLINDAGAGGGTVSVDLPGSAKRGTWKLRIYGDTESAHLLEQRVLVEDFVPERIDFDLAMKQTTIRLSDTPVVSIDAKYLYGAPGADLAVEGEVKLSALPELDGFPGYHFGLSDERFSPRYASLDAGARTGADGRVDVAMALPVIEPTSKPLGIETFIRLRDGSNRPVERRVKAPVQPNGPMIGINPVFEDQAEESALAEFDVIAVGPDNSQITMPEVDWVLNRLRTSYQWYESYGSWSYEPITRRERVSSGTISLTRDGKVRVSAPVDYGSYELKLVSKSQPYTASSYRFYAGWYVTNDGGDTPDKLPVALDRGSYAVGETAKLRIDSRFEGIVQVSVLSDRLIETRTLDLVKGANEIELSVTEEWAPGAYVTATAIRPMDVDAGRNPSRALGLVHATVDPADKKLVAVFDSPAEANPREVLRASLKIDGLTAGQSAFATISAVDVGVLNITGFETPAPDDYYFGQRKLGVAIRDVYGRLIDGMTGTAGELRSGGDSQSSNRNSPPPSEEVLAQFSGLLTVGDDGRVTADFDLPEFNGTVRLMAVVWSENGVGHAEQDVLVRDPVVLSTYAPRFLTPGDTTQVTVELAHAFGPTGTFELAVAGGKGLEMADLSMAVDLADKERKSVTIPVKAIAPGVPYFDVSLTTPNGRVLTKSITLPVQYNDPEVARQTRLELSAGSDWRLDSNMLAGLHAGSVHATLAVGPMARFDAPGLLTALNQYPYGCTEQITSKAMPLLYFEEMSDALGLERPDKIKVRVNQAIAGVLSNQTSSGAFGLWRPDSGDMWLDAFVTDFLSRARAKGFAVPDLAFERALGNLQNQLNYASDFENAGEDVAYALMVLAREGQAAVGDLRYYVDTRANAFRTPLAQAQMGAALASYGDQSRADRMFRLASEKISFSETSKDWRSDYGSHLRDAAGLLTLAVESNSQAIDQPTLVRAVADPPIGQRSTQENLWALMAVNSLTQEAASQQISINGTRIDGAMVRGLSETDLSTGQTVSNESAKDVTTVVTVFGVPSEPEPEGGNGYSISRTYYTMDGVETDLASVPQNSRLAVVLQVKPLRTAEARLMVRDPLPAGFEIDNPNLISGGDISALDWLKLNGYPEHSEFRSDAFFAAVNWRGSESFTLAYIVRAVSEGNFHHPAASVEDMYRPSFRARTGTSRLAVVAN